MAKVKVTNKQKQQAKKYKNEQLRQTKKNYPIIRDIFIEFGEKSYEGLTKLTTKDVMEQLDFNWLMDKLDKALRDISKRTTNIFTSFVNQLFGYNLEEQQISAVSDATLKVYYEDIGKKVVSITKTTEEQIRKVVSNGIEQGLNVNEIARQIDEKCIEISQGRAKTIARTETAMITNESNAQAADEADMDYKIWIHTGASFDDRPEHMALNGTKIKMNESFSVGGFRGMYPLDPNLPPGQTINCNCIMIYE